MRYVLTYVLAYCYAFAQGEHRTKILKAKNDRREFVLVYLAKIIEEYTPLDPNVAFNLQRTVSLI